ncbi:girdin homolog isoform X2 [Oppia nitens]|uniref:girdin homolog isoform X2 n=1 Tax=Oppia nitens TaxID=1686743 RepID=UPI0023DA155F|nr:girdin homolog isoform X2 [Oppia nitens]
MATMNTNSSDDNMDSFEMVNTCESIVAIPDDQTTDPQLGHSLHLNDVSNALQISRSTTGESHLINNLDTRRMVSIVNSLPDYSQIEDLNDNQNIENDNFVEERNASLKSMADNLSRIEDNIKNCNISLDTVLTNSLEITFKELRDENDKLKVEIDKNNHFMKEQIKNIQERQHKNNEIIEDHKRLNETLKQMIDENNQLKEENKQLICKVTEGLDKSILIEELTTQVDSLKSRCEQLAKYEKLDINSEIKSQEMSAQVVESQMKIDSMTEEINALKTQLKESITKLEVLPAMESQLQLFERDFKLEEMAKMAAVKEVVELEIEVDKLKLTISELEERLDKGSPTLDIRATTEELTVGKHHRRHRHSGRHRNSIPVLNVGTILKGFRSYGNTSSNV